jgi:glycosyltransferase involved in cell wall biosynthesis
MSLSVILITKNEEANLKDCLESVSFANEIIVVDSQSSDKTQEISKSFGAKLEITSDWPGFGPQKNRALNLATQEWVLSIDADERVTPALKEEILKVISSKESANCYAIPRSSWYCGRFMKHSGWYPDYVDRLFKRGTAKFSDHLVHERLLPSGAVGQLQNHFLHYSFRDFSQVLKKIHDVTRIVNFYDNHAKTLSKDIQDWVGSFEPQQPDYMNNGAYPQFM